MSSTSSVQEAALHKLNVLQCGFDPCRNLFVFVAANLKILSVLVLLVLLFCLCDSAPFTCCSWKASKAELEAGYAKELAEAKSSHQQRVARLRRQWEKEQKACAHFDIRCQIR